MFYLHRELNFINLSFLYSFLTPKVALDIELCNSNEQGRGSKYQTATLHHKKKRRVEAGPKKFTSCLVLRAIKRI